MPAQVRFLPLAYTMISKTTLETRIRRKTHPSLVKTLVLTKKNPAWQRISQIISGSTRKHLSVNLSYLEEHSKEGDTVVVPGKVLGSGMLTKKIRICALSFSTAALEKMKQSKSEALSIHDEVAKNPKAQGVKIIQ